MKKLIVNVTIIFLTIVLFGQSSFAAMSFTDVTKQHPHYTGIEYVTSKHIMSGKSVGATKDYLFFYQDEFGPNESIPKYVAAYYMVNALGLQNEPYTNPDYTDVTENSLLYKYVAISANKGLFINSTKLNPDAYMTRAETAYMIAKGFNLTGTSTHQFSDVSKINIYNEAIQTLVANGIAAASDKFNPNKQVTRAEFATFIARAMEPKYRVKVSNTPQTIKEIKYNNGLVPTKLQKSYTFRERYESENNAHVFHKIANSVAANKRSRTVTMKGYHQPSRTVTSIIYYEDASRFKVTINMPYTSGLIDIKYPIKAESQYTTYTNDTVNGGKIKHVYTVESINESKTVEGKAYSDVIVIKEEMYYEWSSYPMEATYYLVKNVGLIAFDTEVGSFTLVP